MNAALRKKQEVVDFVWDFSYTLEVAMHYYDYTNNDNRAYRVIVESPEFARKMWKSLVDADWHSADYNSVHRNDGR